MKKCETKNPYTELKRVIIVRISRIPDRRAFRGIFYWNNKNKKTIRKSTKPTDNNLWFIDGIGSLTQFVCVESDLEFREKKTWKPVILTIIILIN